ncbi:hypothetical protein, partial [Paramuribaculum intestinale]|uniref:hypothetical protein n=1 Tax=Paramuribaculum intestinale TaxID=2094151 RepID=UPI00272CF371
FGFCCANVVQKAIVKPQLVKHESVAVLPCYLGRDTNNADAVTLRRRGIRKMFYQGLSTPVGLHL